MKNWQETESLFRRVAEGTDAGHRCAVGTVVSIDVLLPPPEALICGAGDDAMPLAAAAAQAGFRVAVTDHRPAYLGAERFPGAALLDPGDLPPGRVRDSYGWP